MLQAPDRVVEYDVTSFQPRSSLTISQYVIRHPEYLKVGSTGQLLFKLPRGVELGDAPALSGRIWFWDGTRGAEMASRDRDAFLTPDGKSLVRRVRTRARAHASAASRCSAGTSIQVAHRAKRGRWIHRVGQRKSLQPDGGDVPAPKRTIDVLEGRPQLQIPPDAGVTPLLRHDPIRRFAIRPWRHAAPLEHRREPVSLRSMDHPTRDHPGERAKGRRVPRRSL